MAVAPSSRLEKVEKLWSRQGKKVRRTGVVGGETSADAGSINKSYSRDYVLKLAFSYWNTSYI